MKVRLKYKLGCYVKNILNDEKMRVVAIQIDYAGEIIYGCQTSGENRKWYKEYELELYKRDGRIKGFVLDIN